MDDFFGPSSELLRDKISGKSFLREQERQRDLEQARQIALINTESHALIWTGTAEELTATVARWFESGWIVAESLQDALQKASTHFRKPDGTLAINPLKPAVSEKESAEIFSPSPTYQKLVFRGKEYDLTQYRYAPRILKVLHESIKNGEHGITSSQIRKRAKLPNNGKMYDWFRGTGLWKSLVIAVGEDLYRLDIPIQS